MQRTSFKRQTGLMNNKNMIFAVLILLFVIGMFYGTLLAKSQSTQLLKSLHIITNEYASSHSNQPIFATFINSFCSSFIFLIIPYLLGFSAIGQIGGFSIPLFKGLGLGATMGYLYLNFGLKGIGYSALIIIPQTVIALFAIIIACRESIKLSNLFFSVFLPRNERVMTINTIKLYHIKFFILVLIILFSAVVDAISVLLFSGVF